MMRARPPIYSLAVRSSPTGRGLYASQRIPAKGFIVEYVGRRVPNAIADTLGTRYLFDVEDGTSIDGSPKWNTARWINHACTPNAEAELDEETRRVFIYASRDIEAGEEITMDYGEEYVRVFIAPSGCRCVSCTHAAARS